MPSSWDGDAHKGPHYTLTIFPNGKTVLTTPDRLREDELDRVMGAFQNWLRDPSSAPLVIADCLVHMTTVNPREFVVEEAS